MAEEIEKFLMKKFKNGLLVGNPKVHLPIQFTTLKDLLEKKVNSPLPPDEMNKVREALYDVNNLLTEFQMLSSTLKIYTVDGRWPLKKIRTTLDKKIEELVVEGVAPPNDVVPEASNHPNGSPPTPNDVVPAASNHANGSPPTPNDVASLPEKVGYNRWSSRSVDTSKVYGLVDGVISVESMLFPAKREDRFKAIGIVGTIGIGKTTLAQLIFNQETVKDEFLPRIWVCISKQPNETEDKVEIVKRMLVCLGVEDEIVESVHQNYNLKGLLYALRLQLKGKKYLIVLDDAWNTSDWYGDLGSQLMKDEEWGKQLAHGFPKGNGGTVIVTSRNKELAEKMVGKNNIYRVLPLSDPNSCWSIFKDQMPKEVSESSLKKLNKDFEKKCAGLPLAAKVMGQIMNEDIQQQAAQNNQINQVQ